MANAVGCSRRKPDYVRNSLVVIKTVAAVGDTFLHALVLGNSRRLNCSRNRARFLDGLTPMDAAHVANLCGCNPVTRYLGCDYVGFPLAPVAVLSRASGGITQSD